MTKKIFITGTDTGVGKTFFSSLLIRRLNNNKFKTFGIKPVASGCTHDADGRLINEDALALQQAASIKRDYEVVNPIALKEAIAPHIAADYMNLSLTPQSIVAKLLHSIQLEADFNIIEGVGGWLTPLSFDALFSDVVCALKIPVILVVAVKLGCLNHAILTSKLIAANKVPFVGWVANCIEPDMLAQQENIETLKHWVESPYLGKIPYGATHNSVTIDLKNII